MKYNANFDGMLKHDKINNPLSLIKKAKLTKACISLALNRDVDMVHTSKYEEEKQY